VVAKPSTLMDGVLGMLLLAVVAFGVAMGDWPLLGVGLWSTLLLAGFLAALWIAYRYERRPTWTVIGALEQEQPPQPGAGRARSGRSLALATAALAALILSAGTALSFAGDAIAARTGLGGGIVGFLLLAIATSLPEISAVSAAVRLRQCELALGDVFGANLFNLAAIFIIDVAAPGGPVLDQAGRFEILAALLGLLLTGVFVVGLLERRDRKLLRMGADSLAVLVIYAAGLALLSAVALQPLE
jgi:cation:H+ antiporter